jgi:hypothetical protein
VVTFTPLPLYLGETAHGTQCIVDWVGHVLEKRKSSPAWNQTPAVQPVTYSYPDSLDGRKDLRNLNLRTRPMVPKVGSTAPWGVLEMGPSDRLVRLFTTAVTIGLVTLHHSHPSVPCLVVNIILSGLCKPLF